MCCLGLLVITPRKKVFAVLKQILAVLRQDWEEHSAALERPNSSLKTLHKGLALPEAMFVVLGEWHNKRWEEQVNKLEILHATTPKPMQIVALIR